MKRVLTLVTSTCSLSVWEPILKLAQVSMPAMVATICTTIAVWIN